MRHTRLNRTKEGDLRVWNIINPPRDPEYYPVKDPEHAERLIDAMADSQLLIPNIECNVFGLEVFKGGEWEEWENEDSDSISEVHREREVVYNVCVSDGPADAHKITSSAEGPFAARNG